MKEPFLYKDFYCQLENGIQVATKLSGKVSYKLYGKTSKASIKRVINLAILDRPELKQKFKQ